MFVPRYACCIILATVFLVCRGATDFKPTRQNIEIGVNRATEAYEVVCWYEFLKHYLPQTRSLDFNQCHGQAFFQRKSFFQRGPHTHERFFGQFLLEYGMPKIPPEYMKCSQYLTRERYSKIFWELDVFRSKRGFVSHRSNSTGEESQVPYRAFSECLFAVVHEKYGDAALEQVHDRIESGKNWEDTMFERENEFRALHGVKHLTKNDELKRRAQKWAEQLARSCAMYHIHSSHPDYLLNGSRMGENLFMGDSIDSPKEDMALFGTNIWYEEIIYYPYPEYTGYGSEPFHKFSHFSQMIWKGSEEVGYGFAVNASSNCRQYFIVSRYFPPGNFWGQFKDNVKPLLQKSGEETTTFSGNTDGTTRFSRF